jgi:toxin-antitoxin system PIN domain toxin
VGLPWHTLLGFIRISSNPRALEHPMSVAAAWQLVEGWLDRPTVWIPQPTERHRELLGSLLSYTGGQANLVADAHLAALAIEHGLILCSTDGDFARFPYLRWENPLVRSA